MAITVTASGTGTFGNGINLRILVLTNTAATQDGATATSASAYHASITTTTTGSRVVGAILADNVSLTAESGTTLIDNIADPTNDNRYGSVETTSATGTPGATTVGATNTYTEGGVALFEVLPNGTITTDASSPAVATSTTGTSVTSPSFTPPAGSLMVALISGLGTGMSVSDTGSNTWTQKADIGSSGYQGVWIAQIASGQSVSLTTPNIALAAPLVSISGGGTVALTAPNVALAAPLVSASGGSGSSVSLTTPNISLAAPLVSPSGGAGVTLTAPSVSLAAPLVSPAAGGTVALTTPSLSLAAPLVATPSSAPLIISLATQAGTDDYGNAFPEGLSVGAPGGQQVQVTLSGTKGLAEFPSGAAFEQGIAQVYSQVGGTSPAQYISTVISSASTTATGAHDSVQMALNSAADDNSSSANMDFVYTGSNGNEHEYAYMDDTGFNIEVGSIVAVDPGSSPASAATWHTITLENSYTAGTNNGYTDVPQVRMMADNKNLQFKGSLTVPASPSSNVWGTLPTDFPNANFGGPYGLGCISNYAGGVSDHIQVQNNSNLSLANGTGHGGDTFNLCCIVPTQ